ncbi:uncharacterized protein EV420DRAFT_1474488 [Desarmillaria tabescens]|uniref:Uncharacterized protein n=1 Tax=Armillaria tabescens TaxID=1929756 RepID=A0AA39TYY1_ARMTA|nr:uncharacterized protein EV420DRAFT_1474488 [Desarmillaria tabescens]KAK0467099.1 hypothetical protein EV420DRAFT_1474488 [Desarmillaria tabescens]
MTYSRPHWGWFLCFFVLSLPLFFGLFFGLNYKEIIRNGWPLTTCTVNNATLSTRYCCYSDCSPNCFTSAPNGASTCGDLINQSMLQHMSDMHNELLRSNVGIILQSIMHIDVCTLRCPTCYSVTLIMSYSPYNGYTQSNVPYTQDFSLDSSKAETFLGDHAVNSTTKCFYNPKSLTELSLDVSFTAWKWAITALFGMIPILFALGFTVFHFCCHPLYAIGRRLQHGRRRDSGKRRAQNVTEDAESRPAETVNDSNVEKDQDEAPPPYEKERWYFRCKCQ